MGLPLKERLIYLVRLPVIFMIFLLQDIFTVFKRKRPSPKIRLDGKVALVTGANRGMGLEIARDLFGRGAQVLLACRTMESARKACRALTSDHQDTVRLTPIELNLSSLKSVRKCCSNLLEYQEKLDIFVNNAGIVGKKDKTFTEDDIEETCQVNFLAPFLMTHLLLPLLNKSQSSRVVMVTSEFNLLPYSFDKDLFLPSSEKYDALLNYSTSKYALNGFIMKMGRQLAHLSSPVSIHAVHPGCVKTNLVQKESPLFTRVSNRIQQAIRGVSIKKGAENTVYVAIEPSLTGLNGQYFVAGHIFKPNKRLLEEENQNEIWNFAELLLNSNMV